MDSYAELAPASNIRRRNSISTPVIPAKLSLPTKSRHSSSFPIQNRNGFASHPPPSLNFELLPFKNSSSQPYTSLKDLLPFSPSAVGINSPTAASSGYEISIRNRLVKQAAWAYLQPMSSSPSSDGSHFLGRIWVRLSAVHNPITACFGFFKRLVVPTLIRAVDRILIALRVRATR
ncbi:uncharacterized protein LOC133823733 [Humulus lupulus]|uniref:uncharacterized protein LOC133823733 n=1 Tax=Humulus lupulus TaxID=3486 RepID=UPI002B402A15|nr:uncharacterized protein LOC133823733 [Humulus lupulus]